MTTLRYPGGKRLLLDPKAFLPLLAVLPVLAVLAVSPAAAEISGTVLEEGTDTPIAGASVHLQAEPGSPVAISAADGSFTLPVSPAGLVFVAAAVAYDPLAVVNWNTGTAPAFDGDTGVEIRLAPLPGDNPVYVPPVVAASCVFCHTQQVLEWQPSVHASSGNDFWVRDLYSGDGSPGGGAGYVFLDTHDPGETGFCAACHTPMADAFDPGNVYFNEVTDPAALEGVSCLGCHQVDSVDGDLNGLHTVGNATYRFPQGAFEPTERFVWGPLDDVDRNVMRASYAPYFAESRFCASCHQYLSPVGQTTWEEWLASPFSDPDGDFRTCQTCHMPEADADGQICTFGNPPIRPASQRHAHTMIGATPETLEDAILLDAVAEETFGGRLRVRAEVTNQGAGHAFPTGVSVRNAMLVIEAAVDGAPLEQVSGPTIPFWGSDDVPGDQPGDYADRPGRGYAKILEGRINGEGPLVRPVLFIDAEDVWANTTIPSGTTDVTEVEFLLPPGFAPGDVAEVSARLLYRRAFRALAVTKGWSETPQGGPIEIEVASRQLSVPLVGLGPEIPTLGSPGLMILFGTLALFGWVILRRVKYVSERGSVDS